MHQILRFVSCSHLGGELERGVITGWERLTMSRQIGHTSHGITLYFHIRTKHLANERFQSTERDNQKLVFRYL